MAMLSSKCGKPRSHDGGRSPRHAARHAARGSARTFAPSWTDATAHAVLAALHDGSKANGVGITQHVRGMLEAPRAAAKMVAALRLCAADKALAAEILEVSSSKVLGLHGDQERNGAVRRFLKPLRMRWSSRAKVEALVLRAPPAGRVVRWQDWLSASPGSERLYLYL